MNRVRFLLLALSLALAAPLRAVDEAAKAQQAALEVLDGVITRFDALLARDDDAKHKATTAVLLDDFKKRRDALRAAFDQSRYDELRVDLNLEYQRLASWLAAPKNPPGSSKAPESRHK